MTKKVNDGWTDLEYTFGNDEELNQRLSLIINEACHVFYHHADGSWLTVYKPKYAKLIADEIDKQPRLTRLLLKLNDRVVSMITYEAVEILKKDREL